MENQSNDPKPTEDKSWVEEVQVSGGQLIDQLKDLLQQGNARRVTICKANGQEILSVPLTVGVLAGGVLTLAAPVLAAVGVVAGFATKVILKVERADNSEAKVDPEEPGNNDSAEL